MIYYSYFAYATMLFLLFLVLKQSFEAVSLRKQIMSDFHQHQAILKNKKLHNRHVDMIADYAEKYLSSVLTEPIIKLNVLRTIAPAMGLFFTVISIMMAFRVFSESGDIKMMFSAASIGLGTTAIGAMSIVIAKTVSDRVLAVTGQKAVNMHMTHTYLKLFTKKVPDKKNEVKPPEHDLPSETSEQAFREVTK